MCTLICPLCTNYNDAYRSGPADGAVEGLTSLLIPPLGHMCLSRVLKTVRVWRFILFSLDREIRRDRLQKRTWRRRRKGRHGPRPGLAGEGARRDYEGDLSFSRIFVVVEGCVLGCSVFLWHFSTLYIHRVKYSNFASEKYI